MLFLLAEDLKRIGKKIWLWLILAAAFVLPFLVKGNEAEPKEKQESDKIAVGVINHDTSVYSQMVTEVFLQNEDFLSYLTFYIEEEEQIQKRFAEGELDMYLEIPKDFADSMVYLEHLPVEVVISTQSTAIELLLKNMMEGYAKYIEAVEVNCVSLYDIMLASGMTLEEARRMNDKISLRLIMLALSREEFFRKETIKQPYVITLLPFFLHEFVFLLLGFLALLCGLRFQKERHAGILRRLQACGVNVFYVLFERFCIFELMLAGAVMLVRSFLTWTGRTVPAEVAVVFVLAGGILAVLMLLFAAGIEKMQSYLMAANLFLLFGAVLGGGIIPYMYMPKGLERAAVIFPNYWFLKLVFAAWSGQLREHLPWVAAGTAAGCIVLLLLAAVRYRRRGGVLYGNAS